MEDNPFVPQTRRSEEVRPKRRRRWIVAVAVLLTLLLLGLTPLWLESDQQTFQTDHGWRELQALRLETVIAAAVIDARRGQYEVARENARRFFGALRQELDRGQASALSASQRDACEGLLAQRDELITQLARGGAAAGDRLTSLYLESRRILRRR